jgi:hypothetical protein
MNTLKPLRDSEIIGDAGDPRNVVTALIHHVAKKPIYHGPSAKNLNSFHYRTKTTRLQALAQAIRCRAAINQLMLLKYL